MNKLLKNKFFTDPQNIIAVGVTLISLCALIVSIIQTSLLQEEREMMREYSRASVWPHLDFGLAKTYESDHFSHFKFLLTNSGVGPAIITDVKVTYKDSIVKHWWHLFDIMEIPDSIGRWISSNPINKKVVKIGETIKMLDLDENLPLANVFAEKMKQEKSLSIEIYYESIYGEKWKVHNGKTTKIENFKGLPEEEQFH